MTPPDSGWYGSDDDDKCRRDDRSTRVEDCLRLRTTTHSPRLQDGRVGLRRKSLTLLLLPVAHSAIMELRTLMIPGENRVLLILARHRESWE